MAIDFSDLIPTTLSFEDLVPRAAPQPIPAASKTAEPAPMSAAPAVDVAPPFSLRGEDVGTLAQNDPMALAKLVSAPQSGAPPQAVAVSPTSAAQTSLAYGGPEAATDAAMRPVDPMRQAIALSTPADGGNTPAPTYNPSANELLSQRGKQLAQGAGQAVAGVGQAVGLAQGRKQIGEISQAETRIAQLREGIRTGVLDGSPFDPSQFPAAQAEIERLTKIRDAAAAVKLSDTSGFKAGEAINKKVGEYFGTPDPRDKSFWGQVAQGAGNVAGMAAVAIPTLGTAGFASGVGMSAQQMYQDAIDSGATEETARQAASLGGLVGTTEMLPLMRAFKVLPKPIRDRVQGAFVRGALKLAEGSGEEAIQEYGQQVAQNLIAQKLYDPQRGWSEGAATNALVGAIVGAGPASVGAVKEMTHGAPMPATQEDRATREPMAPAPGTTNIQQPDPSLPVNPDQIASPIPTQILQKGEAIMRAAEAGAPIPAAPVVAPTAPVETPAAPERIAPAAAPEAVPTVAPAAAPDVPPQEAAVLFGAGYTAEDITDMSPAERAAEIAQARDQGVVGIDPAEATKRLAEHAAKTETPAAPAAEAAPAVDFQDLIPAAPAAPVSEAPAARPAPAQVSEPVAAEAAPASADERLGRQTEKRPVASWVIRNKATGEVVMETFDRKKVDALNTAKYEAVPVQEHLASLNKPAPFPAPAPLPSGYTVGPYKGTKRLGVFDASGKRLKGGFETEAAAAAWARANAGKEAERAETPSAQRQEPGPIPGFDDEPNGPVLGSPARSEGGRGAESNRPPRSEERASAGGQPRQAQEVARTGTKESGSVDLTPAGEQRVMPGAERISDRALAERGQNAPKRGGNAPMQDNGLFGDEGNRGDLFDPKFARARRNRLTFSASPEFTARAADVARDLARRLAKIAPKVDLAVVERMFSGDSESAGLFQSDAAGRFIAVALEAPGRTPVETLGHEAVHALRDMGLFTRMEWAALERRARADEKRTARAQDEYPNLSEPEQTEEVIADQFGEWLASRDRPGSIWSAAMEKIRGFLAALRSALRGHGFTTPESVFGRVASGKVGERTKPKSGEAVREAKARPSGVERIEKANAVTGVAPLQRDQAQPNPKNSFDTPARTAWLKFYEGVHDNMAMLDRAQKEIEQSRGAPLRESVDTYLATSLYETRRNDRIKRFWEQDARPLLGEIDKTGVNMEDLRVYLIAKHAPERNALMAQRDPQKWSTAPGSGVSDAAAAQLLADLDREGNTAKLEAIAQKVYAIIRADLNRRHAAGLISTEQKNEWAGMFQRYVPLRGWAERDDGENAQIGQIGRGFDVRGPEARQILGRMSQADHPLTQALAMAQDGLVRIEKNKVGKTLLKMATEHPNVDLFRVVGQLPVRYVTDLKSGQDVPTIDFGALQKDRMLAVKVGGKAKYIELSPELAHAFKNLGLNNAGKLVDTLRMLTRQFSRLLTGANPDFFIPNAESDFFEALITAAGSTETKKTLALRYAKNYAGAMRALAQDTAFIGANKRWKALIDEWEEAGGRMEFMGYKELSEIESEMDRAIARRGKWIRPSTLSHLPNETLHAIERLNAPFENAARLAMYVSARQMGVSKAKAALMSLDSTSNFMRRGRWSPTMGALYPFFNASVKGIEKFGRLANPKKHPYLFAAFATVPVIAAFQAAFLASQYPDDDDPEKVPLYFKIDPWERARSIIVPTGVEDIEIKDSDGNPKTVKRLKYTPIRLPYNLRPLWVLGDKLAELAYGATRPGTAAAELMSAVSNSFNPLGGDDVASAASPLVLDPILELSRNRDSFGSPIHPEPYVGDAKGVNAFNYKPLGTGPAFVWAAQAMNKATGGNSVEPGMIDVYPDDIQYLSDYLTGGVGKFISRGYEFGRNVADGAETAPARIPLVRTFIGKTSDQDESRRFYDALEVSQNKVAALRQAKKLYERGAPIDWTDIEKQAQDLGARVEPKKDIDWKGSWTKILDGASKDISKIRQDIYAIQSQQNLSRADKVKQTQDLQKQIEGIMRQARENYTTARMAIPQP